MTQSERVSDEELQYQIKLSLSPTKQKMARELQHLRKLVSYVQHKPHCPLWDDASPEFRHCTCGLDKLIGGGE